MFGGVDSTTRPHLVEDDCWTTAHNLVAINTFFSQVPPKVLIGATALDGGPILGLLSVPSGANASSAMIALTPTRAYLVKFSNGNPTFEDMYLENYQTYDNHLNPTNI